MSRFDYLTNEQQQAIIDNSHKPVTFVTCPDCFAAIILDYYDKHSQLHHSPK